MYICNAFSLQMIKDFPCTVDFEEVKELPRGLESAIGHADTARVLGYPCNRVNVSLSNGDTVYIAQLVGGRLPEGATILPKRFSFKYLKATIHSTAEKHGETELQEKDCGRKVNTLKMDKVTGKDGKEYAFSRVAKMSMVNM